MMDKKPVSASNPYDDALEWFKNKNGVDFLDLVDNKVKRQDFYKKASSTDDTHEERIQACYKHTISEHYR